MCVVWLARTVNSNAYQSPPCSTSIFKETTMRTLLIPALALIMGYPAFAKDEHSYWKYRSHRQQAPQIYVEHDRRDWERERFEHREWERHHFGHRWHQGYWSPESEFIEARPEPQVIRVPLPVPVPLPPPPHVHLWFGF
jgi:hypothetical protein